MSIYGDFGNILAMQYMLAQFGIEYEYQTVEINQALPEKTDFYFIGGGQDKEQLIIYKDLLEKKDELIKDLTNGVCMLAVCGGYQLLGQKFLTGNGEVIPGLNILPITTTAPDNNVNSRCVGNLVIDCSIKELEGIELVGFENHSGQTFFIQTENNAQSLGTVIRGYGNNSTQKHEGCIWKNTIGTYLHGSCLPKNPELTRWFINQMLKTKGVDITLNTTNEINANTKIANLAKSTVYEGS